MVYDSFQFFNELDILYLRMNILKDVVDKFVISESTVTFSGDKKPLFYEENKEMFREFEHKIIHNVVDDTPMDCDAFTRDHHQKCAVARGLAGCMPEDIVIFSDVDEIPNPETLKKLLPTVEELRNKEQREVGVRVPDGGWHFSYMGGGRNQSVEDRVKYKIKSAAHQEYNNRSTLSKVRRNIKSHQDIFGRDAQMVQVEIDGTFPAYLRENIDKYQYLLYRKPKWYEFWK